MCFLHIKSAEFAKFSYFIEILHLTKTQKTLYFNDLTLSGGRVDKVSLTRT